MNRLLEDLQHRTYMAIEAVERSIATVRAIEGDEIVGYGTGFFVDSGILVTAHHLVDECSRIEVVYLGRRGEAKVIGYEDRWDIAFLSTSLSGYPMELHDGKPRVGAFILVSGYTFGSLSPSHSLGIVSCLGRKVRVRDRVVEDAIQTDALVTPGMSGGPAVLLDKPRIVGMAIAVVAGYGPAYLAPSLWIARLYYLLKRFGRVPRLRLGVELAQIDGRLVVVRVVPGSSAYRAGIRCGDVVEAIDECPVRGLDDVWKAIYDVETVEKGYIDIYVRRSGSPYRVRVFLDPGLF